MPPPGFATAGFCYDASLSPKPATAHPAAKPAYEAERPHIEYALKHGD
jgi:hypothetical protein